MIPPEQLRSGHPHDAFATAYYAMSPGRFEQALRRWKDGPPIEWVSRYSFVDLGCGKGRAVLMATATEFRQVIGVELHPGLAATATHNLLQWTADGKCRCPATVLQGDALEFDLPDGPCLLYLFHPFGAPLMGHLVGRLREQLRRSPRPLDVLYFNPEESTAFASAAGFDWVWTESFGPAEPGDLGSAGDLCSLFRWVGDRG